MLKFQVDIFVVDTYFDWLKMFLLEMIYNGNLDSLINLHYYYCTGKLSFIYSVIFSLYSLLKH